MLIELKQNVFRFLILSHINDLLINKELITNSIKKAVQQQKVPRTVAEVESGLKASTEPFFEKTLSKILKDLQAFAIANGDAKRRGASESTADSEISVEDTSPTIQTKSFMLQTAWGYLNTDELGIDLTSGLEESFASYLSVCRTIGSWTLYLAKFKDEEIVKLGASALAELSTKWGPVGINEDLDDFYNRLFGPLYYFALDGKVDAILSTTPIGIAVEQIYKKKIKFDEDGLVNIVLPISDKKTNYPNFRYYITDIDYSVAEDLCGIPDVTIENNYEACDKAVEFQLTAYEGVPICKREKHVPTFIMPLPPMDPPPPRILPVPPPMPPVPAIVRGNLAVVFITDCSATANSDSIYAGANAAMAQFALTLGADDMIGAVSFTNIATLLKSLNKTKTIPANFCDHH